MNKRTIRRLKDIDHVSRAAADEFVRIAQEACAARKRFAVALAGGSTPRSLYQHLAEPAYRSRIDWSLVQFFWGDERAVPPDHADSNYRMAHEAMLHNLAVPHNQIHRMQAERSDLDQAARDYQAELARVLGAAAEGEPPVLDLVLLGMGADGHTASLFPHTPAIDESRRWVVANFVPKLNAQRMTLTPVILNRAANVLFMVAGPDKAASLAHVLEGARDPHTYPSQIIQGNVFWFIDDAAAAKLTQLA